MATKFVFNPLTGELNASSQEVNGTSGQIGFFNSASHIMSNADLTWDNVNKFLKVGSADNITYPDSQGNTANEVTITSDATLDPGGTIGASIALNTKDTTQGFSGLSFYGNGVLDGAIFNAPASSAAFSAAPRIQFSKGTGESAALRTDTGDFYVAENSGEHLGVGLSSFSGPAIETKLDINGEVQLRGEVTPAVSSSGNGRIYFDSIAHTLKLSRNGGSYLDLESTPKNVYIVGPNGIYTTIQSAINQAVADGFNNDDSNPAFVLIYPKGGSQFYVEDLTLKDGISLIGMPAKGKGYTVGIQGQMTYTPQGASGPGNGIQLTIVNLYISAGTGKSNIVLNGANAGRIWLRQCYLDKSGDSTSMVLMNGSNSSVIEAEFVDGNITASGAGCTIWDIQNGTLQSFSPLTIGSTFPGKIINCGASGIVNANINSNCTGANAITIATGGSVTISLSSIKNNQANSNGANISTGGTLTSFNTVWNIPTGTGSAILGVLGSVYIHVNEFFVANSTISTAIGAGNVIVATQDFLMKDGHLKSQRTTAPTTTTNANAGTGASSSVANATDMAGTLTLTTGSLATASGVQCTVNFNRTYVTAPIVTLTPNNNNGALDSVVRGIFVTSTTSGFSINFSVAETVGTTYKWNYHVIETQ